MESAPDTPGAIPEAFREAWMARDAARLAALFAEDADFVNVTGIRWRTRADIEKAHAYALGSFFSETDLRIGRVDVRRLGDIAIVHARMILTGQKAPDGTEAGTRRTQIVFVAERRGTGWTCLAAQNTEVVPGAETFEATEGGLAARDYRETR